MADQPDSDIRRFIQEHVASVAALELLLLLHASRGQTWSTASIAGQLRVDERWTAAQLKVFESFGFIRDASATNDRWEYHPKSPELDERILALAKAYLLQRVSVIEAIYARPSQGITAFADAFHINRRRTDG